MKAGSRADFFSLMVPPLATLLVAPGCRLSVFNLFLSCLRSRCFVLLKQLTARWRQANILRNGHCLNHMFVNACYSVFLFSVSASSLIAAGRCWHAAQVGLRKSFPLAARPVRRGVRRRRLPGRSCELCVGAGDC